MPSMMLVFRGNFTEVVEITTTFIAMPRGEHRFNSYIHVLCVVSEITAESSAKRLGGECTKLLKKVIKPVHISDDILRKMKELKKGDDLGGLLDDLPTFNLKDETE